MRIIQIVYWHFYFFSLHYILNKARNLQNLFINPYFLERERIWTMRITRDKLPFPMFTSKCSKTMFKKKEEKTLHEVILILSNSLKLQKKYKPNYRLKTKLAISINATNKFFQLRHNSTEHLSHHLLVYLQFKNWILYIQNFIGISYPTKIERKIK